MGKLYAAVAAAFYLAVFAPVVLAQANSADVSTAAAMPAGEYNLTDIPPFLISFAKRHDFHGKLLEDARALKLPPAGFAQFYEKQTRARLGKFFAPYHAVLDAAQRDYSGAYARYSSQAAARLGDPEALLFKSITAFIYKRYGEALEDLKTVVAQKPGLYDGLPYYWRGKVYAQLDYPGDAVADFNAALEMLPGNPAALNARSQVFFDIGYYSHAAADLNGFFRNEEAESPARGLAAFDERCETLRYKGYTIADCADLKAEGERIAQTAVPTLSSATTAAWAEVERIASQSGIADNKALSVLCQTQSAEYLRAPDFPVRRFKTAIYLMDKAVELDPRRAAAYARRGLLKFRLAQYRAGAYADALADLRAAAALDPGAPGGWVWHMIAVVCEKYDEFLQARSAIDEAARLDPKNPYFHHERARVLLLEGDLPGAQAEMDRFFSLSPDGAYAVQAASGPECRMLALQGLGAGGCKDKEYFAGANPVSRPALRLPPW